MRASKFTEAQKAFILKQGNRARPSRRSAAVEASSDRSGGSIVAHNGSSQATYFNWKKKYGGLLPDEMRRLKALEDENTRLKSSEGPWPRWGRVSP